MPRKRPSLAQYERAYELTRARVPGAMICQLTELTAAEYDRLLHKGLRKRRGKGKHAAQPSIRARLLEDQASQVTDAAVWGRGLAKTARETASHRAETASIAAQLEKWLIGAWGTKARTAIVKARASNKPVDLDELLAPKGLLDAMRALKGARDLASDVRAPLALLREGLDTAKKGDPKDESKAPPLDLDVFSDLLEMDDDELLQFALAAGDDDKVVPVSDDGDDGDDDDDDVPDDDEPGVPDASAAP